MSRRENKIGKVWPNRLSQKKLVICINRLPPGTYMDSFIECWQEAAVGIAQCFYPLVNHPDPSLIMLHVLHLSWQSNNRHTSVMGDYFWHFYHWPAKQVQANMKRIKKRKMSITLTKLSQSCTYAKEFPTGIT